MLNSENVDTHSLHFDKMISRLQSELDSSNARFERLKIDDSYDDAVDENFKRPQPTSNEKEPGNDGTLLYVEVPDKCVNSVIR